MTGTRLNDCDLAPGEKAKYDAEREAQIARAKLYIRSDRYVSNPTKPPPRTQDFIAWLDAALAALEKARTEATVAMEQLSRLRADAGDTEVNYARELSRMKAEIARLRAPPAADVMELVKAVRKRLKELLRIGHKPRGIKQHFGYPNDPRFEFDEDELFARALTAYGDQRAHEASTLALEEAAQLCDDLWVGNPGKSVLAPKIRALKSLKVKSQKK
jgi:hypothetical protein